MVTITSTSAFMYLNLAENSYFALLKLALKLGLSFSAPLPLCVKIPLDLFPAAVKPLKTLPVCFF